MTMQVKSRISTVVVGIAIAVFMTLASACTVSAEESIAEAIEQLLVKGPAVQLGAKGHGYSSVEIDKRLLKFYGDFDFQQLWISENRPNARAETLHSFLGNCFKEGLNPESYRTSMLDALWEQRDSVSLAKMEILLSMGLANYVADIREGRIDPLEVDPELFASAHEKNIDMGQLAREATKAPDFGKFLRMQSPQHQYYKALIPVLARYRKIAENGGWPSIPEGPVLRQGIAGSRVLVLRKRLSTTGDLNDSDMTNATYDPLLEQAVKRFQERHYLNSDGVIGKNTLKEMNVPVERRIRQIIVNMERWRWISRKLEGKQIFVNIAGFHVVGVQGEEVEIRMPVIVGKAYHMTPVFSNAITYAEINPFWNVPASIARGEYLPKLRRDPNVLQSKHIRIFSGGKEVNPVHVDWNNVSPKQMGRYRLRQDPGPWNALGTVKFIFPNPYSVYLHDTPSHALFQREKRTFSHGCVRVSRPHELAVYILGGQENGWTVERVKEIIDSGKRTVVNLNKPLPVHIIYRTAVATEDGVVRFGEDIYGRDALLEKALF